MGFCAKRRVRLAWLIMRVLCRLGAVHYLLLGPVDMDTRGVLLGILDGGVRPGCSNPDPISDPKLLF